MDESPEVSVERLTSRARVLLALLAGVLLVFCFPQFDLHLLAWVALVPLFLALAGARLASAFGISFLAGLVFFRGVLWWFDSSVGVKWWEQLILAAYLGSYPGLFGLAFAFVARRTNLPPLLTAPCLWVAVEYLRSHAGFLAFPWALLGHTQYTNIPLIQIVSVTGVYGLSFLIVLVNVAVTELVLYGLEGVRGRRPGFGARYVMPVAAVTLAVVAVLGYGWAVTSRGSPGPTLAVGVVQGNVSQGLRWRMELTEQHLEMHIRLTREVATQTRPSLVVWPETAVPGFLPQDAMLLRRLFAVARETGSHLLVGSAARPKTGPSDFRKTRSYNSAFLVSPQGRLTGRYDKIRLLPFGEYLPYRSTLSWPARYVGMAPDYVAGDKYGVLALGDARVGVTICWENIFPEHVRALVRDGAEVVVNMTNEAWFAPAASYQFLAMSVFRAAEHRVAVVRAANTGISGFIDGFGRIIGTVREDGREVFVQGVASGRVPRRTERTFYTVYGDLFAHLVLACVAVMLGLALIDCARAVVAGAKEAVAHGESR